MPTWASMTDLSTGDLVTEADMDAIRGNIEYLLDPNADVKKTSSTYTTSSTSWADVDATNVKIDITTNGGPLLILGYGMFSGNSAHANIYAAISIDGTVVATSEVYANVYYNTAFIPFAVGFIHDVPAGSYTVKMVYKVNQNSGRLLKPVLSAIEL